MSPSTTTAPKKRPTKLATPPKDALAYRLADACALLGIGRSTMYLLIGSGTVKTIRIGGRHVVPRQELERLAATGTGG